MKLYQAFDVDEVTPVQWLAVHPLRWQEHWGEPAIMFCEVDDETQALADAAPALLAACKFWLGAVQNSLALRLALTGLPEGAGPALVEMLQEAIAAAEGESEAQ